MHREPEIQPYDPGEELQTVWHLRLSLSPKSAGTKGGTLPGCGEA